MGLRVTDGPVLRVIPGDLPPDGVGQLFQQSYQRRNAFIVRRGVFYPLLTLFRVPDEGDAGGTDSVLGSGFGFISG